MKKAVKIWSSLELDLLSEEIVKAGISKNAFILLNKPQEMLQSEILFGAFSGDISLGDSPEKLKVKWIQLDSVDASLLPHLKNVQVTNIKGLFSGVIAETVIGSLLALYRGLWFCRDLQLKKQWQRWPIRKSLETLIGKKVVILGGGSIAQEMIKLLKPFQCSVVVYRRKKQSMDLAQVINRRKDLISSLKTADIVMDALPVTEETKNFLSMELLGVLKKEAVVVNVGRGATVDEDALKAFLKEKRIQAAILDVTQQEPILPESDLWDVPNLHLTHHTAGGHREEFRMKCEFFAKNLKRYLKDQPLINRVKSC